MDYKKVSVIVPVYNTEKYVEKCIRSILAQTYRNLEVICVDDGSTDKSGLILDEIAKQDKRLRVIHNVNSGVGISRNVAMQEATGEYYGFVDSDDYIAPNMYEILVETIEKYCTDIVTCGYYFDYEGRVEVAENQYEVPCEPMKMNSFWQYIWERDRYKGVANYLWTKLFKKNLIKTEEGNLIDEFGSGFSGTDIVFMTKVGMRTKNIVYIDKPLYFYFQRESSIVHNSQAQLKTLSWIEAYEQIFDICNQNNLSREVIEKIQRMYVYRCGKVLEDAIRFNDVEKTNVLKQKIIEHFPVYVKTNLEHIDRIKWLLELIV